MQSRIMKNTNQNISLPLAILAAAVFLAPCTGLAHGDGMDGPVVKAAQKALADSNINLVLIWVQKNDEPEIKHAFERTLAVRKFNNEAKELADLYFFETLVRTASATECWWGQHRAANAVRVFPAISPNDLKPNNTPL